MDTAVLKMRSKDMGSWRINMAEGYGETFSKMQPSAHRISEPADR